MEPETQRNGVPHIARLVRRNEAIGAAVAGITRAIARGDRLLIVHADTLDGASLNLALEEAGIRLPFRSGPVELVHDVGSRSVLADAAARTLSFEGGPLRAICMSHPVSYAETRLCLPIDGFDELAELECFFTLEQPTADHVARLLRHDEAVINGDRFALGSSMGELAVLGALLGSTRRVEAVDRLIAHPGFLRITDTVRAQLRTWHRDRIEQRHELAVLRGHLTTERRLVAAAALRESQRAEIDAKVTAAAGDIDLLMNLAEENLGVGVVLEDDEFERLRSTKLAPSVSVRALLGNRVGAATADLEPGEPTIVRLGRPADGSQLMMRLASDVRLGYLSIPLQGVRATDQQTAWLKRLHASVAAARRIEVEMSAMVNRVGRHILREMVSGSLSPVESRVAAAQLGWTAGGNATLVVLSFGASPSSSKAENRLSALCDRLNDGEFTAAILDEEIVVLCLSSEDLESLATIAERLDAVAMGIGAFDDHPESAQQVRMQAAWAARLARSAGRASLHFGEIGIHRLLLPGAEGGDRAFENPIRLLEEQIDNLSFDPIETLRVYLESGASPRQAAATLNIHVNTLRYRIKRISTLSQLDLANPENRFQADLALRLRLARRAFG